MHRIDSSTRKLNLFGAGKDGFTQGSPGVEAPTQLTPDFFNQLQEEPLSFIEAMGLSPVKADNAQLNKALKVLSQRQAISRWQARSPAGGFAGGFNGCCMRDYVGGGGQANFVAVGASGEIQTSEFGDTWTKRTAPAAYASIYRSVCVGQPSGSDLFVAVGQSGAIHTSPTGVTWTAQTPAASYTGEFKFVAWLNGQFIALGTSGEIQTSPNGTTWTKRTPGSSYTGEFRSAAYGAGLYVIIGQNGEIQTSPDGVTWTRRVTGSLLARAVAFGNGVFVAVFGATTDTGCVRTSTDGINWTNRTLAAGTPVIVNNLVACVFVDGLFVLSIDGGFNEVQTSVDGVTWKRQPRLDFQPTAIAATARGNWMAAASGAASLWTTNQFNW